MAVTEGVKVKEDRAYPAKPVARIASPSEDMEHV